MPGRARGGRALVLALLGVVLLIPAPAAPEPLPDSASRLVAVAPGEGRALEVTVYSAAMRAELRLTVLPARDPEAPAPVLYLLNGSGGDDAGSWTSRTDIADFLAGEQVTVVMPRGGTGSYFTDWRADDPVLGHQRWATFLTGELPPIVDSAFRGTGANAVAGISMSAASALQLPLAAPGLYRAAGSFSGCVRTSDPAGQALVTGIVASWGGDARNMWGPFDDPAWAANDTYLHAERLRGLTLWITAGSGQPGPLDTPAEFDGDSRKLADQIVVGGALETVAAHCTRQLRDRLAELGIPATAEIRPAGTHSWGYWEQDLHHSWPVFRDALTR